MTTLAERQEWLRNGCPIDPKLRPAVIGPSAVEGGNCANFRLSIDMKVLKMFVDCTGCGFKGLVRGMLGARRTDERADWLMHKVTKWMFEHARAENLGNLELHELFSVQRQGGTIKQWIKRRLSGERLANGERQGSRFRHTIAGDKTYGYELIERP